MFIILILGLIAIMVGIAAIIAFSVLGAGAIIIAGDWIIAILIIGYVIYKLCKKLFD